LKTAEIIGIIPARAGSKRIAGKNIKRLGGKPLIQWTIEEARKSKILQKVMVSTESHRIARLSKRHGALVPALRPKCLAKDGTPGVAPILHACTRLKARDIVVCLQPTSPFRKAKDIDACLRLFFEKRANCVVSVSPLSREKKLSFYLHRDGTLARHPVPKSGGENAKLWQRVSLNGAIYAARVQWLQRKKNFLDDDTLGYFMPARRSLDIDTMNDWREACKKIRKHHG